jgi:carbamoyltransferase
MGTRVVGLNRTQDASVCLLVDGEVVCLIQKERLSREKHAWGALGDLGLYARRIRQVLDEPLDLVVECYSSDKERRRLEEYEDEIRRTLRFRRDPRIVRISHHLAHVYSAYVPSGASAAAGMVIDYQGSRVADLTESWPAARSAHPAQLEVASFYDLGRGGVDCIGKQLWDKTTRRPVGLGAFYLLLTTAIFGSAAGQEGKTMGLAPYGNRERLRLPPLRVEGHEVFIPDEWLDVFTWPGPYRFDGGASGRFQPAADLAAAGQRAFEDAVLELAGWLHRQTGAPTLCFAGGCALNCSANGRLLREGPFERVYVPPAPGDGGTAAGCALYGQQVVLEQANRFSWVASDFLGPPPSAPDVALLRRHSALLSWEEPPDLAARIADVVAAEGAAALWNGRAESGPRALGHRSIVADPRSERCRLWINARVKGRERFRPLAPMVLLERAADYFETEGPLPFMQFAVAVKPERAPAIPAVTHVDGSARIQTVAADGDPLARNTLEAFERLTGVPVLLNTSFNGKDEPMVETFEEALSTFLRMPLPALAAPPFLVRRRNA